MGPVQADPAQILEWGGTEVAAERVLNRTRGNPDRRGDVAEADIEMGVFVNESDRPAQRLGLRGGGIGTLSH